MLEGGSIPTRRYWVISTPAMTMYATRLGHQRWSISRIADARELNYGRQVSLVAGADGHIHVLYFGLDCTDFNHLVYDPTWLIWMPVSPPEVTAISGQPEEGCVGFVSAQESADGILHVAYYDPAVDALRYARRMPGSSIWESSLIVQGGGRFAALAIGAENEPHIAFSVDGNLMYACEHGDSWVARARG